MNQEGRKEGHVGILLRGGNGSLWFMRDDYAAPVEVDEDIAEQINHLMGHQYQEAFLSYPLSDAVIAALNKAYGPIQPHGVIHGCATQPSSS